MKINLMEAIRDQNNLFGHFILNGLQATTLGEIADSAHATDGTVDVVMTVNGHEVDVTQFLENWKGQVNRMIGEEVQNIVKEKFATSLQGVYDGIDTLKRVVADTIEQEFPGSKDEY